MFPVLGSDHHVVCRGVGTNNSVGFAAAITLAQHPLRGIRRVFPFREFLLATLNFSFLSCSILSSFALLEFLICVVIIILTNDVCRGMAVSSHGAQLFVKVRTMIGQEYLGSAGVIPALIGYLEAHQAMLNLRLVHFGVVVHLVNVLSFNYNNR